MHQVRPPGRSRRQNGVMAGLLLASGFGCGGALPEDEPLVIETETFRVAAEPPGGEFSGPITITLHSEEPATLYYTTDGTAPSDDGVLYEGPFEVEETMMLTVAGVNADGVWSHSVVEYYEKVGVRRPAREVPRILSFSRPQVYFSARPGDDVLEQTIYASSIGTDHVLIHRAYISAAVETGGFYEPGVFRLETPVRDATLLAPGERIELRISYRPTETLRSASLVFETDDMRTETGAHEVRLTGRIFNW